MHKALQANAPFPYPQLVTLFLQHFNVPLDDEHFVKVKRSFAIGAAVVAKVCPPLSLLIIGTLLEA